MLYIIAGHGGSDPGAIGGGYSEHAINVEIARAIKRSAKDSTCVVLDTDIDHYAAQTMATIKTAADDVVLEVHMDAYPDPSAKGGHVIIWKGYDPDDYDEGLEEMLKDWLPGRAVTMVKRGDLYNCNVAAKRGINYRLVEFGFITNPDDRAFILNNLDKIGRRVCEVFGISRYDGTEKTPKLVKTMLVKDVKKWYRINEDVEFFIDMVRYPEYTME